MSQANPRGRERRRYPRKPPGGNYVISCYRAEWTGQNLDNYNMANKVFDLGPKGARMLTRLPLTQGVPVIIDINVPQPRARFKALAIVRWARAAELDLSSKRIAYEVGLEFDKLIDAEGEAGKELSRALGGPPKKELSRRSAARFAPPAHQAEVVPHGFLALFGLQSGTVKEIKDISLCGAQIVTPLELRKGRTVTLTLRFQSPNTTLRVKGEVRWSRRIPGIVDKLWRAGLRFRNLKPSEEQSLQSLSRFAV